MIKDCTLDKGSDCFLVFDFWLGYQSMFKITQLFSVLAMKLWNLLGADFKISLLFNMNSHITIPYFRDGAWL